MCKPAGKARRSHAVNTLTGKPTRDSQALEAEIAWLTMEIAQARARLVTAQRGADENLPVEVLHSRHLQRPVLAERGLLGNRSSVSLMETRT
ncbi:MAG: hypothetical protein QOC62_4615 [Mycobacterium sp.]|nr:hypothetical protein [Mycobacterium sp.]